MSLLHRSELRLHVGLRQARASLWQRGLHTGLRLRRVAQLTGPAQLAGSPPLLPLLDALQAQGHALPARASVCLDDEQLYLLLHPASGRWSTDRAQAAARLAEATGEPDLQVQTLLAPGARAWLAVGVPAGVLAGLREDLAARDLALARVDAAFAEDLHRLGRRLPREGCVLLLREAGAVLVRLAAGRLVGVDWERLDPRAPDDVVRRVEGHLLRQAAVVGGDAASAAVLVLPADAAQHAALQPLARRPQWQLLQPLDAAGPAGTAVQP